MVFVSYVLILFWFCSFLQMPLESIIRVLRSSQNISEAIDSYKRIEGIEDFLHESHIYYDNDPIPWDRIFGSTTYVPQMVHDFHQGRNFIIFAAGDDDQEKHQTIV